MIRKKVRGDSMQRAHIKMIVLLCYCSFQISASWYLTIPCICTLLAFLYIQVDEEIECEDEDSDHDEGKANRCCFLILKRGMKGFTLNMMFWCVRMCVSCFR